MGTTLTTKLCALVLMTSGSYSSAWNPGVGNESNTSGFSVDTQSRNDVVSFWHCVYQQSEGYESRINWTGSVGGGNPGTTSSAFKNDVQRRINYYRAMAGMSANINMANTSTVEFGGSTPAGAQPSASTTKQNAAQQAALMRSRNHAQSGDPHDPPSNWNLDGAIARNGAFHSSLSNGLYGPSAIDAYISEDDVGLGGAANDDVAHRRYLFYSRIQEVATGDVTGSGDYPTANALYVSGNLLPAPDSPQYIAWPNAGYIPEAIVPVRWSVTYPNANFQAATVTITDINGDPVTTTIVSSAANFADNTLVWIPNAASTPSAEFDDQVYNVTISNILIEGNPTSHNYTVTVINPNRLLDYPALSGSTSPPDSGANYFFNPIELAEEYELNVSTLTSATWVEGAEDGTDAFIVDGTDPAYNLRTTHSWSGNQFWDTGSNAFRLVFPKAEYSPPAQSFTINRTLIPHANGKLKFRFRRGYLHPDTKLFIQSSINGGASWTTLKQYSGTNAIDTSFGTENISLPSTNQNTKIRFILDQPENNGNLFDLERYSSYPIGVFIDGIESVNCDVLESLPSTAYASSTDFVTLNASTGGGSLNVGTPYILRVRAKVGCHWFPYGNSMEVTPVPSASLTPYENWFRGLYAIVGSFDADYDGDGIPNGLEHVFGLNPTDQTDATSLVTPQIVGGNVTLSHSIISGGIAEAECSNTLLPGSWEPVPVTISEGTATASVPLNTPTCFLRWKAVAP